MNQEIELLTRITAGDEEAFARLFRMHWKNVYAHALGWIRSAEEAEEITQDIFIKVWHSRSNLSEVQNFENWLFIIARNTLVSAIRKKLKRPAFLEEQALAEKHIAPSPLTEDRQYHQILLKGISLLPDKRQQVFRMSRLEGLTHAQIAEQLGIHKDTVAQYIIKAIAFLKTYLREQTGEEIIMLLLLALVAK